MNREKHFHPLAALHLLRKTLLVYLLPLVQVLFDRNWDALRAALRQELVLLFFISAVCWAVYYGGRWQVDAEGTVHVSWRLGVRLDRALRTEGLAVLVLELVMLAGFVAFGFSNPFARESLAILFDPSGLGPWFVVGLVGLGLLVPLAVEAFVTATKRLVRALPVDLLCIAGGLVLRFCVVWSGMH